MKMKEIWMVGALLVTAWSNFVQNGQFEDPLLDVQFLGSTIEGEFANQWVGRYQLIGVTFEEGLIFSPPLMGSNQCIDLTVDSPTFDQVPGYVSQNLSLEQDGIYRISYRWMLQLSSGAPETFQLTTLWDGQPINVLNPTSKVTTLQTFQFEALAGNHILKFQQTQYTDEILGFLLDSISVEYVQPQPTQESHHSKWLINILIALGTLPRNLHGLKSIMLIVDDLWLYVYDDRQYSWLMENIFDTISKVETLKWSYLSYHKALPHLQGKLKISSYENYSNPKYMLVEDQDGSFIRSLTLFIAITIPQTAILCLIMRYLFHLISQYQISSFLRRYCFLPNFLQIVLEPNVGYFTYLFFNQAKILFSFSFGDKAFIGLAVALFFFVLCFSIAFFALVSEFYQKKAGYFLLNFFRIPKGLIYATIRINVRSFLYGVLHSLLFCNYFMLMGWLTCLEVFFLIFAIIMEMAEQVYITRVQFVLASFYHVILVLLNATLVCQKMAEEESLETEIFLYFQKHILTALATVTCAMAIIDFIPMEYFQIKKPSSDETPPQNHEAQISDQQHFRSCSELKRKKKKKKNKLRIITNLFFLKQIELIKKKAQISERGPKFPIQNSEIIENPSTQDPIVTRNLKKIFCKNQQKEIKQLKQKVVNHQKKDKKKVKDRYQ